MRYRDYGLWYYAVLWARCQAAIPITTCGGCRAAFHTCRRFRTRFRFPRRRLSLVRAGRCATEHARVPGVSGRVAPFCDGSDPSRQGGCKHTRHIAFCHTFGMGMFC